MEENRARAFACGLSREGRRGSMWVWEGLRGEEYFNIVYPILDELKPNAVRMPPGRNWLFDSGR